VTGQPIASALPRPWPGDLGHLRVVVANGKLAHQRKAKSGIDGFKPPRFLWVSPPVYRRLLLEDATRVHGLVVVAVAKLTGTQVAISDRRPNDDEGAVEG
jgi:hypothetical protein